MGWKKILRQYHSLAISTLLISVCIIITGGFTYGIFTGNWQPFEQVKGLLPWHMT